MSGLRQLCSTIPAKPRPSMFGIPPATNALRSIPALNPRPAPVSTPTLSSSSPSKASSAAAIASASSRFTALRASGRLMVITRT